MANCYLHPRSCIHPWNLYMLMGCVNCTPLHLFFQTWWVFFFVFNFHFELLPHLKQSRYCITLDLFKSNFLGNIFFLSTGTCRMIFLNVVGDIVDCRPVHSCRYDLATLCTNLPSFSFKLFSMAILMLERKERINHLVKHSVTHWNSELNTVMPLVAPTKYVVGHEIAV